jgi:hypothetical protein
VERSGENRDANVGFANELLSTEVVQRNARKEAQESTARWIILTIVALMTLLLTLSGQAGILNDGASWLLRGSFVGTLVAAAASGAFAGLVLWPRRYERLGAGGYDQLNREVFLDQPRHAVMGAVLATQIEIAKKMDQLHEVKARWLKWAFRALGLTLAFVVVQGILLGVDPPRSERPYEVAKLLRYSAWDRSISQMSCKSGGGYKLEPQPLIRPCPEGR